MSNNGAAYNALQAQIDRLRGVTTIAADVAPACAEALHADIAAQVARGEGPDGRKWQLTEAGRIPLRNAMQAVSVRAIGTVILARVVGPEALHHLGGAKGGIKRQIIPTRAIPDRAVAALRRVITDWWRARMGA